MKSDISKNSLQIETCGQCKNMNTSMLVLLDQINGFLNTIDKNINIYIMGCTTYGTEESWHADIALAFSTTDVVLIKEGDEIARIKAQDAFDRFKDEVEIFLNNN